VDYSRLLSTAGRLVWQHRFFWVLGAGAALGGGLLRATARFFFHPAELARLGDAPLALKLDATLLIAIMGSLFLGLVFWLVAVAAEGGVVVAVAGLQRGQTVTGRQAIRAGVRLLPRFVAIDTLLFFPLFVLILLVYLLILALALGLVLAAGRDVALGTLVAALGATALACILPLLCLLLPVGALTLLLRFLAFRAAALERLSVRASVAQAWHLLRRHAGSVLILALLLWGINYVAGLLLNLVLLPFQALLAPAAASGNAAGALWLGMVLLDVAPRSLLFTFTAVAWTLVYPQLAPGMRAF
jgi:hypothetical protein